MAERGKNNRRQIEAYDQTHDVTLSVDSLEEVDFVNFCDEAVQLSAIDDFVYQPCSFRLFDSENYIDVNGKARCLFRDHVYSPDFCLTFDPKKSPVLAKEFKIRHEDLSSNCVSAWVDVKGLFNKNVRSFSTDRKWVWQKFRIYICEVIPKNFFKLVGCPAKSFYTRKTGKARKLFAGCKSVAEALGLKSTRKPVAEV